MSGRLRSRLTWQSGSLPAGAPAISAARTFATLSPAAPEKPTLDIPTAPRESTIALLHIGSEVEHALMAQYLYAAYTLNEDQADEAKRAAVKAWKSTILQVAREEMGHLATVQNILTLIGGPLCFERDDFPLIDPDLWPFPFELERLTKDSLGKYVLAEMPSEEVLKKLGLAEEIEAIKQRLHTTDNLVVHRVGLIYEAIIQSLTAGPMIQGPDVPGVTSNHPFVATVDIQSSSLKYQVTPGAWGLGYKDILIETASDRPSAIAGVTAISVQGEGSDVDADYTRSHFGKFLAIYREFPEESDWHASRPVASNPTTNPTVDDPARRITGDAAVWAALSNLRYRMLLLYLKHSFYVEVSSDAVTRSPRGALVSWAFGEMYNIRSLSEILLGLPLSEGSDLLAGPPFEMPYTLALPARSADRWRSHRDLLTASIELTGKMLAPGQIHEKYLRALRAADETALQQVTVLVGA